MLAVGQGPEEVLQVIQDIPGIGIACYNAPDSVTLSGTETAVDEARGRFARAGVFNRKLITSGNAYHSELMTEAGKYYETFLKTCLLPNDPPSTGHSSVTMFSSVTEQELSTVELDYWRKNLESPVRFDQATQNLLKERPEVNVVIEIGPHSALAAPLKAIRTSLGYSPERLVYLSALKRNTDSVESLLKLAGSLFLSGWPLDISTINADETIYQNETGSDRIQYSHGSFIEDLPTYQWTYDEDLLWTESRLSTDIRFRSYPHHDLLGSRLPGTSNGAPAWRNLLSLDHVPWLRDHRVGDDIVFPAAGYVCLAVEAVTQICGSTVTAVNDAYTLRDVNITSAMVLKEGLSTELMFDLWTVPGQPATYQFSVSTFSQGTWTQHATGSVLVDSKSTNGEFSLTRTSLQMLTFKQINCCGLVTGMSAAAVVSTRTAMIAVGMLTWTRSDWSMDQVSRRFPISVLALIIIKRLRRFRGVQPTG
jgi:acyl transferase domain-containing protein